MPDRDVKTIRDLIYFQYNRPQHLLRMYAHVKIYEAEGGLMKNKMLSVIFSFFEWVVR
jgi:hypothetical protein